MYASARRKSEVLALMGALFLIADYLITASLSAVSCFEYMGVQYTEYWAMGAIAAIGCLNFFGPKHSGNLAFALAVPTLCTIVLLSVAGLPYIFNAIQAIEPLQGGILKNWNSFVGIIVALSGIEAIANTTGVMKLDSNSDEMHPSVHQTSKRAIIWVMAEVCFFTALLGLLMNGLPGLHVADGNVYAPNQENVRDAMLRYMANYFGSHQWGPYVGYLLGALVSFVFGMLLLSAVNTALLALVSLLFVMSRDGEFPFAFQKLNRFGVPIYPLLISTAIPLIILAFVHDVAGLAELYAVGFVGAIATNLGSNVFDKALPMKKTERTLMLFTFFIMVAIELTLLIFKPPQAIC